MTLGRAVALLRVNASPKSRPHEEEDLPILSLGLDAVVCLPDFTFIFSATLVCFVEDMEQNAVCLTAPSSFISFSHFGDVRASHPSRCLRSGPDLTLAI